MKISETTVTGTPIQEDHLRALVNSFRLVSVSLDLGQILSGILKAAGKLLPHDAAGIFVFDPATRTLRGNELSGYERDLSDAASCCSQKGIIGRVMETGIGEVVSDVTMDPDYVRARSATQSELAAPIIGSQDESIGVINLESDRLGAYTENDLQLLTLFASMVAVAIEKADLHKQALERRRLEYELQVASGLMAMLMPTCPPTIDNFTICGRSIPSAEVGGDYFDFMNLGDGRWGLAIADVSGKGIPAALVMASFRAYLHALMEYDFSLRGVFNRLNRLLLKDTENRHFVTAFFARFDPEQRRCFYINAGHNPPILVSPGSEAHLLTRSGIPLGTFQDPVYSEEIVYFKPMDTLVLYTDGVTEATSPYGESFGLQRLVSLVQNLAEADAPQICQRIIDSVKSFTGSENFSDDLTIVIVRADDTMIDEPE